MHHLAEAQFVGRIFLRRDQRFLGAGVVHFDQQQSGFDPRHIQRQHSGGVNIELLALFHHRVPDFHRVVPRHPDFIAQIAGVSGARDVHGNAADLAAGHAEIFEIGDVRASATAFSSLPEVGPCSASAATLFGNVLDLHIHVQAVLPEPAQAGVGGGPAIVVFFQPRDRAVVDDLALLVAPAAINHLSDFHFVDVAGDDAVHQLGGVLARDQILVERRNIDQRGRIADGVVLVLVMHLVHADRVVARPLAVVQAVAKRKSSLVKCGSDWQRQLLQISVSSVSSVVKDLETTEDTEDTEEISCWIICSPDRSQQFLAPDSQSGWQMQTKYASRYNEFRLHRAR